MKEKIAERINSNLAVKTLEIKDVSHLHQGHSGWQEGGETHFNLLVVSDDFQQKSRIERHKVVLKMLEDFMKSSIHALSMKLHTEQEYDLINHKK